jgi:hypothetical protein
VKILFIDNSVKKAELIVGLLNVPQAEFIICCNAEEGIETVKQHQDSSLIILDQFIINDSKKTIDLYKYASIIRSINHEAALWLFSNVHVYKGDSFYRKCGFTEIFIFTEISVFDQILFALNNMVNHNSA